MSTGTITAIVVVAVLVIVLLVFLATQRRRRVHDERLRHEAAEHRRVAAVAQVEADRRAAEAEEQAARARREALAAEQARLQASEAQATAASTWQRADELDPDLDADDARRGEVRGDVDTTADIDRGR
jgi:hypothetical protein